MRSILIRSKIIIYLIFLLTTNLFAQNSEFNLKKYWYLRWRLTNYFMVVGEGPGKSLPAGIRRAWGDGIVNGVHHVGSLKLNFGDAPNYLGAYIGVLATEYKLLSDNNQSTVGTLEELYYALKAIIRLDNCEAQYPWNQQNNVLNGACSRGDVPIDFVYNHKLQLHKNLNWFDFNSNLGDPSIDTMRMGSNITNLNDDKHWGMMSQDHISSLMVAMALVTKFIPNNISYNGFWFVDEAKNITNRFVGYMVSSAFFLKKPDGSFITNDAGGHALPFASGFIRAALKIDISNYPYYLNLLYNVYPQQNPVWAEIPLTSPGWWGTGNTWIFLNLAAVGDSWNTGPCILNTPLPQCTQHKIWQHSKHYDWSAYYPLLHAVLHNKQCKTADHKILSDLNSMPCSGHWNLGVNNVSPGWATSHKYHSTPVHNEYGDFNNLSASGQYNALEYMLLFNLYCIYKPNYVSNYYPILAEDAVVSGNVPYMLPYPMPPSYLVAMGAENNHWPAFYSTPQVIHSFRSLQSTAVIENKNMSGTYQTKNMQGNPIIVTVNMQGNVQANVTYKAGEGITLKPGFHAKTGAIFHAYIDPLTCNNNRSNYERYGVFSEEEEDDEENKTISKVPEIENLFSISPNPANGMFSLSYAPAQSNTLQVEIINITGTLVYSKILSATENKYLQTDISISDFAQGVYLLRLQDGSNIKTARMVVQ
ncbi:MAG: T9SS type A sorting domain-containing protein [Flavobacteriales bacterium]|nr:T9SS type A sorting domain-containing protein [Flavobacteriales bacterium]